MLKIHYQIPIFSFKKLLFLTKRLDKTGFIVYNNKVKHDRGAVIKSSSERAKGIIAEIEISIKDLGWDGTEYVSYCHDKSSWRAIVSALL